MSRLLTLALYLTLCTTESINTVNKCTCKNGTPAECNAPNDLHRHSWCEVDYTGNPSDECKPAFMDYQFDQSTFEPIGNLYVDYCYGGQTAAELCAENPYINSQSCIVACTANPYDTDSCSIACDSLADLRYCCAAGDLAQCDAACDEDYNNHQACCAAGDHHGGACSAACEQYGNREVCSIACNADITNHEACCYGGDQSACCDADGNEVGDETKKMGCCYKALHDDDPATVCLASPIDSAELKKQQNSASC